MKPLGNARQQLDRRLERKVSVRVTRVGSRSSPLVEELGDDQVSILACLRGAKYGLTMRQLENSTACSPAEIRVALDRLIQRGVAGALNTLIPSYISK